MTLFGFALIIHNKRRKLKENMTKLLFYEYDIDTFLDAFFYKKNSLSVSF